MQEAQAQEVLAEEVAEEVEEVIPGSTPAQVAQLLGGEEAGWSGRRVRRYIRDGTFPATKYGGRWRMEDDQIEAGLASLEAKAAEKQAKKEAKAAAAAEAGASTGEEAATDEPF